MKTSDFEYELPPELIAQQGLTQRDRARLMVLDRRKQTLGHREFRDIIDYINPGDSLVLNNTRVIPARFHIRRDSGGVIEGLFLNPRGPGQWQVLLKNASRLKIDEEVTVIPSVTDVDQQELPGVSQRHGWGGPRIKVIQRLGQGQWLLETREDHPTYLEILNQFGVTPLPPYIHRQYSAESERQDRNRYQTVYAQRNGSVAAPTAGLHFTEELLEKLRQNQIRTARVTLHVGMGTFKPVTSETLGEHEIHAENYCLTPDDARIINDTLERGNRVIAVGTTSVRTLETVARNGRVVAGSDTTRLFIIPGYQFQVVGGIITNFHLPRSTLLALVCAFAGKNYVMSAYNEAVRQKYRFYSYGDAMMMV